MESLIILGAIFVTLVVCLLYVGIAFVGPLEKSIDQHEERTSLEIRSRNRNAFIFIGLFAFVGATFSGLPPYAQFMFAIIPIVYMTNLMRAYRLDKGFMNNRELEYFAGFIVFMALFCLAVFRIANPFQAFLILPVCTTGIIFCFFRFSRLGPAIGVTT